MTSASIGLPDTSAKPSNNAEPYEWILHPVIDSLMVCGGLTALFALVVLIWPAPFRQHVYAFQVASLILFSMPHGIASYLRVYNGKDRSLVKPVTWLGVAIVTACCASLVSPIAFAIVARVTWFFGVQHLLKQSYGLSLLYCYKRKFFFNKWEQKSFWLITVTAVLQAMALLFTRNDAYMKQLPLGPACLPLWTVPVAQGLFFASLALFVGVCVRKYIREKKLMPWPAVLCMLTTLVISGALRITGVDWLLLAFILAPNFHLTQYVVVTTAFHIKEVGLPEDVPANKIYTQLVKPVAVKYLLFLLGAGFITSVLIIPLFWDLGLYMRFSAPAVVTAVFMAINLHHYLTDALIWRQRNPNTRKILVA